MRFLALFVAGLIVFALSLLARATVDFHYRRQEENDHLEIQMSALGGLWKFQFRLPSVRLEWEEGPQLEIKQQTQAATGEKRKARKKIRFRYFRRGFFYHLWPKIPGILIHLQRAKAKFYRGIHCTQIVWEVEIGYENAAYTAIAAGSFWGVMGYSLAKLYRQVTVETEKPKILVIPHFNQPGFSCDIRCIFKLRIGHIMLIGLDVVRAFLRGKRRKA